MDDRQLLELAAKAAGLDFPPTPEPGAITAAQWDPRKNDGDAFRLAVKLGIQVGPNPASREPMVFAWAREHLGMAQYEMIGDDPYAATRRAIVRAAAAIQQSKESGDAAE